MPDQDLATKESWKTHPMPERREQLAFDRIFTPEEFAKIRVGHIPQEMEDKWFVFFEEDVLYFHRSWTGYCIFQLKLEEAGKGWHVVEAWVSRDRSQYKSRDAEEDLELLTQLFRWSLGI